MKIFKTMLIAAIISAPIATLVAEGKTSTGEKTETGNVSSQNTGKNSTGEKASTGDKTTSVDKISTGNVSAPAMPHRVPDTNRLN